MFIRTKDGRILDTQNTNECIYVIRKKNIESENCYVSYHWNNWEKYFLIDYQNCMLFSYNSAQIFISDLMKENLNYQDLVIELSPYYKDCKQANTIEELCDEFVQEQLCFGGVYKYWILPKLEGKPLKTVMRGIKDHLKDGNIKGAIWTNKGLIYVAKMNEKGELVLL